MTYDVEYRDESGAIRREPIEAENDSSACEKARLYFGPVAVVLAPALLPDRLSQQDIEGGIVASMKGEWSGDWKNLGHCFLWIENPRPDDLPKP